MANWQTCVELTPCSSHRGGSVSLSAGGVCEELFSPALIASVTNCPQIPNILFLSWKSFLQFYPSSYFLGYSSLRRSPRGSCDAVLRQKGTLTPCAECWSINKNISMTRWVPISQALFISHYIVQYCLIDLTFSPTLSPRLIGMLLLNKWSENIRCDSNTQSIFHTESNWHIPRLSKAKQNKTAPVQQYLLGIEVCVIASTTAASQCGSRYTHPSEEVVCSLQQIPRHSGSVAGDWIWNITQFCFS